MRRASTIGNASTISRAVISTIGQDRPGVVNEVAKVVHDLNLSIEDSRMTVLGGEFAVLMSVTGGALHLQRLETRLVKLAKEMDLAFLFRLTGERGDVQGRIPYTVSVTAMDHPGIVHLVAGFFSSRNINIYNLDTVTERAAHTGTPIFSLVMEIEVPPDARIAELRDNFFYFCDDHDLDAELRPA